MAEERTGVEVVAEDSFSPTFKKFEEALKKSEASSETFGRALRTLAKEAERVAAAIEKDALASLGLGEITAKQAASAFKQAETIRNQAKALYDRADAAEGAAKTETSAQGRIGSALASVGLKYAAVAAVAYTAFRKVNAVMGNALQIAQDYEAAMGGLQISARAAEQEFGAVTGTTGRWMKAVARLSDEMRIYSETDVARATARTIDMTKRLGLTEAQMEEVIRRSGDLASKTGVDLTSAVERVTAALRGEAESAEYLGLSLNETQVRLYAESHGLVWKELDEGEKARQRYLLFLEQSEGFVGAAVESTDTLKGAQAEANAAYEDAAKALGEAMIPLTAQWAQAKADVLTQLVPMVEKLKDFVAYVHIGGMALVEFTKEFGRWSEIMQAGPLAAIPALVRSMGDAEKRQDLWNRVGEKSLDIWEQYHRDLTDVGDEIAETPMAPPPSETEWDWDDTISTVEGAMDRIGKMQEDHLLQLQRAEEDAARARARAWADYEKKVAKEITSGEKKIADLTEKYEEERAEAVEDSQKEIAKAEEKAYKEREKAQRDFEREMRQARERYNLDRLQSERRYQYERNRLIAEGDTLAIEQLDEQYALEQQEAEENQEQQEQQAQENFSARLQDMQEAADEMLAELRSQLSDTLAEQEESYQEQLQKQQEAQAERLAEMAEEFAERQRMEDEDRAFAAQRREEDYQRQLRDLGESLADQLREQELGADAVQRLLDQYWDEGGISDAIMAGFHEREDTRIAITEEMLNSLAETASAVAASVEESVTQAASTTSSWRGWTGVTPMQRGGVLRGPALAYVEPGMTEAFIPLNRGTLNISGNVGVNVSGLESANPADVSAIASAMARELTTQVHRLRSS